jgi:hypothetical protein
MKKYVFGLGSAQVCIHPFSMHHATSQYFTSLSQHIGKGSSSFQFGKAHSYTDGLLSLLISACLWCGQQIVTLRVSVMKAGSCNSIFCWLVCTFCIWCIRTCSHCHW